MLTATEALERLKSGNQNFVNDRTQGALRDRRRRSVLAGGQSPYAIVLSCADSRVAPELTFDTGLGEIFVVRVAGNVANTSSIASIEYAVAHLGTELIVVLGHEGCGAVTAALGGGDHGHNLNHLLAHITPAVHGVPSEQVEDVIRANASYAAKSLIERSGIIRSAVESGDVKIVAAYYEMESGQVSFLGE